MIDDEIYRGAEREADDTPSVWGRYDRAIVSSGLSKAYGTARPAHRLARRAAVARRRPVGHPRLHDDRARRHQRSPRAHCARARRGAQALLARTRGIIRANYPLVQRWIEQQEGLSHIAPEAGAIVFVRHTHPFRSSELTDRLREEHSVLLVPGDYFDMDGYFRIGFGSRPELPRLGAGARSESS